MRYYDYQLLTNMITTISYIACIVIVFVISLCVITTHNKS